MKNKIENPKNIDEVILHHFIDNYESVRDVINVNTKDLHFLSIFTAAMMEQDITLLRQAQDHDSDLFDILLETEFDD